MKERTWKRSIDFIYTNRETDYSVPDTISMCYLPSILLDSVGIKKDRWFDFLYETKDKSPILTDKYIQKSGQPIEPKDSFLQKRNADIELFESWCYFRVNGKEKK